MSSRLVTNSVNLDDLERRNSPNLGVILPNTVTFGEDYVKVVADTFCSRNVGQKIEFLMMYYYGDIVRGSPLERA